MHTPLAFGASVAVPSFRACRCCPCRLADSARGEVGLAPVIDMLNHDPHHNTHWAFNRSSDSFDLTALHAIKVCEHMLLSWSLVPLLVCSRGVSLGAGSARGIVAGWRRTERHLRQQAQHPGGAFYHTTLIAHTRAHTHTHTHT